MSPHIRQPADLVVSRHARLPDTPARRLVCAVVALTYDDAHGGCTAQRRVQHEGRQCHRRDALEAARAPWLHGLADAAGLAAVVARIAGLPDCCAPAPRSAA